MLPPQHANASASNNHGETTHDLLQLPSDPTLVAESSVGHLTDRFTNADADAIEVDAYDDSGNDNDATIILDSVPFFADASAVNVTDSNTGNPVN